MDVTSTEEEPSLKRGGGEAKIKGKKIFGRVVGGLEKRKEIS